MQSSQQHLPRSPCGYGSIVVEDETDEPIRNKSNDHQRLSISILLWMTALLGFGTISSYSKIGKKFTRTSTLRTTTNLFNMDSSQPDFHYYFAYGAMCNPTSRLRRNVTAIDPRPAKLSHFAIDFSEGVADLVPREEGEVQGVLMQLNKLDWEIVRKSEAGYQDKHVHVVPYGASPVMAHVFYFGDFGERPQGIPQERYLKIIAEGMRFHGVDERYIRSEILDIDFIPSRKPDEYLSFPRNSEPLPMLTFEDYMERASNDKTPCFLVGDYVVDLVCAFDHENPWAKALFKEAVGKPDVTPWLESVIYDPDMPLECRWKWAENFMVDTFASAGMAECPLVTHRLVKS